MKSSQLEEIYKQDYPNLIACFHRNTVPMAIGKSNLEDHIDEPILPMDLSTCYQIDTNIKIQEAELFKEFTPESLNDALFNNPGILRKFGRIRCLSSKGDYLAVGSNLGAVLNFYMGQDIPKGYNEIKREANNKIYSVFAIEICQCEHGSVNNLTFNNSATQLSVGFDNGVIGVFDLVKMKNIKWLKIHANRIVSMSYINDLMLVSCDEIGNTFVTRICKGTLFYDIDSQLVLKQQPISCIKAINDKQKLVFNLNDTTIFAIGNGTKCWVLRVNDQNVTQLSILWDINNENISNNQCLIEWSLQKINGKDTILIGILWEKQEKSLSFVNFDNCNGKLIANFKLENQKLMELNLVYMNNVYNNLILILTEKGNVFTTNLHMQHVQKIMQMPKFDLVPLMYWRDKNYESQFSCCISNNELVQEIYILTESQIVVLKYYNFEEKFRHFMEHNKYNLCLQILLCVHRKMFMEIDQNQLIQLATQVVTLYLQVIAKLHLSNQVEEAKQRMLALVQFVLELKAAQLISIIDTMLDRFLNDQGKFFVSIIEPFISNSLLTFMPDEALMKTFTVLKLQSKRGMINKLLNQLDITKVNQSVYLQACLENSLFQPMINLCIHPSKNEFLTPLFQIWSFSQKQMYLELFDDEILFLRKAISYMEFLLKGKLMDGTPLVQGQYFNLVEMMIVWLFDEQNLKRIITIDPNRAFELFYNIFHLTTIHLIEFTHKQNMRTIDNVVREFLNPSYKHHFKVKSMINSLKNSQCEVNGRENSDIEGAYSYFLLRMILILKLKADFEELMQVLLFCAYNQSFLFQIDYRAYAQVIDRKELPFLESHPDHSNIIEYFQQKLMLKLTIDVEQSAETEEQKEQTQLLNNFEVLTHIPLVQAHLNAQNQEYILPINAYLNSNNKLISQQVFKYLKDKLQSLHHQGDRSKFNELNDAVLFRLQQLIKMDIKQTRELIFHYQKNNEQTVIEKLDSNPILKLEYIETIIKQDYQLGLKIDNDILKQHIELLCKLRPNEVLCQLKCMDYPLEDVLKICQECNNLEATAYILERLGLIIEAMEMQQKLLNNQVNQLMVKMTNFDQTDQSEFVQLNQKMDEILYICIKNNKFDNSEDVWYHYLDNLINLINQCNQEQLRQILVKRTGELIEEIAVHTYLDLFAQNIVEKYYFLNIKDYKNNFIKILNTFYYQLNFIQNIKIIISQFTADEYRKAIRQSLKGYSVLCYCDICGLKTEEGIQFQCGHFMHINCYKNEQVCPKCLQSEQFFLEQIVQKQKSRMNKLTNSEKQIYQQNLTQQIGIKLDIILDSYKNQKQQRIQEQESFISEKGKLQQFDIKRQSQYNEIQNLRDEIL